MSCPREKRERAEHYIIGPYGLLSENSRGRPTPEDECCIRTCFQRDIDRITHSKSFRRLKHKTQVFLQPEGDHYRTRLTHTLEVSRLARTVSRALVLNEDLAEAIALGHDLGHTPFGHAGERALNDIFPGGFPPLRAEPARCGQAREGRPRPEPLRGDAHGHLEPHPPAPRAAAWRPTSSAFQTASPT
ncbi:MAG: HD domain-containing protein [Oscillospiraceae bacterium]